MMAARLRATTPRRFLSTAAAAVRNDWTRAEIGAIYRLPFTELLHRASTTHRQHFDPLEVQRCTLLSIKTGGCNEDCKYCAQSTRYKTFVKPTPMMSVDEVVEAARRAKAAGSTRFCMGTAWRELGSKKGAFGKILSMVEQVNGMGLEVCCTLGMVNEEQARQLKAAGLTAYNHNLDTSREHYPKVITTRSYDDRLQTIKNVRKAGISVCCGGILGLGESEDDRIGLLQCARRRCAHAAHVAAAALHQRAHCPPPAAAPLACQCMRVRAPCRCAASCRRWRSTLSLCRSMRWCPSTARP
jgi:biotin synthase